LQSKKYIHAESSLYIMSKAKVFFLPEANWHKPMQDALSHGLSLFESGREQLGAGNNAK
jgi:hypothetical protein